ncbi:hypothetical protein HU200_023587 [Digitaria exilis]|uniref:Uncharacterized protein n=1 Tax=Digitaria exilis TaxID=1010633 RepID=A0A835BZS3_9POAL|nr:hypothetical protein HU200_023587 [Digitaria exilis]
MIIDEHQNLPLEDVIDASSQSSKSGNHVPQLDLNEPVHVDVFIPMEDGQPLKIMPVEFPEEELLGHEVNSQGVFDDERSPDQEPELQAMQLGFVEIDQPEADPVFTNLLEGPSFKSSQLPPSLFRLWAAHFAAGPGSSDLAIPPEWAAFFTTTLMNPGSFEWAKRFLLSSAWAYPSNPGPNDLQFEIPSKCPVDKSLSCMTSKGDVASALAEDLLEAEIQKESPVVDTFSSPPSETVNLANVSPSTGPWARSLLIKAGKLKVSEDDPALRRSCRQKSHKQGFKGKRCQDKQCIACHSHPPTISPTIIKNLGTSFCKVGMEKLDKVAHLKRKKAHVPVGKKSVIKKKPKDSDNDDVDKNGKKKSKK